MRDEFPAKVKQVIALRVNYVCSNPTCGASTSGPQASPDGFINIGVAAHITAAASGGPRFLNSLSPEERKSADNGIWLCQNCAKLIDSDVSRFSEALLRHWKQNAEELSRQSLGRQSLFSRAHAPAIQYASAESPKLPASSVSPPAELIKHLSALLPQEHESQEDSRLLDYGYGAMGQQYAVAAAGFNYSWRWNVCLFTAGEFGWELVATVRLDGQHGWIPEAVYIGGSPGAIVLTHVHGYGTGLFRRSTSWYRIAKAELLPILSYPHDFYVHGWGMPFARRLTSAPLRMPSVLAQGEVLTSRFDVSYSMIDEGDGAGAEDSLFEQSEALSLEWNEEAQMFIPLTADDDFARIEELWNEDTERFSKQNMAVLKHLSAEGTDRQQRFIRTFLLPIT